MDSNAAEQLIERYLSAIDPARWRPPVTVRHAELRDAIDYVKGRFGNKCCWCGCDCEKRT